MKKKLKEIIAKIKKLFRATEETVEYHVEPISSEDGMCKTLSMSALVNITNLFKDCPIKNLNFGYSSVKMTPSYNDFIRYNVISNEKPTVVIKANCVTDRKLNVKTMKVQHIFYTVGLDGNLWKLRIITFCKGMIMTNDWDQLMIEACNMYCSGMITANHMDAFSKFKIEVPDMHSIDIISKHNYDGYLETYGNRADYYKLGETSDLEYDDIDEDAPDSKESSEIALNELVDNRNMVVDVVRKANHVS